MKRFNNLFEQIVDIDNIKKAHLNARKGKTHYREVQMIDQDIDYYAQKIREMLIQNQYEVGEYDIITKKVDSGKIRQIYRLAYYPHRIIHHAIMQIMEPIWKKTFIADTYCCIKGRGIHKAVKKIQNILYKDKEYTQYCLKLDVEKFYPNINNDIMKDKIRKKIKDKRLLELLDKIIDSADGLPIGNYMSQYFANIYLSDFDHYCKEQLGIKYYFRYCDDIIFMHADKNHLHHIYVEVNNYLTKNLKLKIKDNWQIFPVDKRGIDFLGHRFYHGYTLLRKRIAQKGLKLSAKICKQGRINLREMRSIISYYSWLKHCNALHLRKKMYNDKLFCIIREYTLDNNIKNPLRAII